jgi:hypothetical protein
MQRTLLQLFASFTLATTMAPVVLAQSKESDVKAAAPHAVAETESAVKELIQKLSSTRFADRQQASKDLLNVEPEGVQFIEAAAAISTGETQQRLRMILPQLRKRLFDDHLDAFLANPSVEIAERLPQWSRFEQLAGHDADALAIFGQILSAERRLFAARLFAPNELSALLETRSAEIAKECNGLLDEEFPIASVASVMLLGSEPETRLRRATSTNISSALDDQRFSQLITDGVHAKTLRAIAEVWISRAGQPGVAAERPLLFSMQHKLPAGRTVAIRIIESKSPRPDMIYSLLCLASLNSTDDLPLIESLFENETVLWPQRGQVVRNREPGAPPVDTNYNVQTRDVALAAAAHLHGISPNEVRMKVRESDLTVFAIDSLGFSSNEARVKALAEYRRLAK